MLAPRHRLRRSSDFGAVVRTGRRAGRPRLVVHLLPTGEPVPARCGFVVSKAVGSATVRNTVKRRLRHLMRENMSLLPEGSMLVVRALPPAAAVDAGTLRADLDKALDRLVGRGIRPRGGAGERARAGGTP